MGYPQCRFVGRLSSQSVLIECAHTMACTAPSENIIILAGILSLHAGIRVGIPT